MFATLQRLPRSAVIRAKTKHRHIGPNARETDQMLQSLGYSSMDSFLEDAVPAEIRLENPMELPPAMSETEALRALKQIAAENKVYKSFIGKGYYDCIMPSVIQRNILENPGWYTAYTPYQSEISQGRLESLLNFQTMISDLTGLPVANASLLDEGTAAAEAMNLCYGSNSKKRTSFFVSEGCHAQTIEVLKTRAQGIGVKVVVGDVNSIQWQGHDFFGILLQYPNTHGSVEDYECIASTARENNCAVVAAADLLSLALLKPPGEFGADIAVGSAQRFGVPLMYGGPHAGYFATTEKFHRKIPGRIIGVSKDSAGNKALRMAMQTREQHIRRDKATSNICTAQALLANISACYGVYHGPAGIKSIATRVHKLAAVFAAGVAQTECKVVNSQFFDTVEVDLESSFLSAKDVSDAAEQRKMNINIISDNRVSVSMGESITSEDVKLLLECFGLENSEFSWDSILEAGEQLEKRAVPESLKRSSPFLTHSVFNSHHSETQMMRYLKSLEDKDLSLNTSMISLGSCTMKLNAVSELTPVSWPEFANVHPFAPADQCSGYRKMIRTLHEALASITGFDAVSSQPNSGAQGEYAGLLCIQRYQESLGQSHRNVCLIPVSAHGTNPASAVMAGMKVVTVKSGSNGNIDREDLSAKINKYKDNLSCLMLTYPSTYGVFENGVKDICREIHENGGQVYMDGANMNAQVGLCNPGELGADVCHLNLHKTFCIPHGGGGPGVGSIGVRKHLAPFLPGNPVVQNAGDGEGVVEKPNGSISSSTFGSAGILPISWMYIHMLGAEGLRNATSFAILNANYMAKRLENHFDVLFRSESGRCAHEFIIDIRPFKKFGIVEEDIAKRLQDYGFHSPTMSWPVAGTLMIEPTESEDKQELDRLCDALIGIRGEIQAIESGIIEAADSPLKNSPHTMEVVCSTEWHRNYSRETAAFPAAWQQLGRGKKLWPSVGRIDNVYGDRNLMCTCPPLESYSDE